MQNYELFFCYRNNKRGMNKSGSYCHNPLNRNNYPTITFYTNKYTFDTFENPTGDADTISFLHGIFRRRQVNYLLVVRTGDGYKMAHLDFRNDNRLLRLTIHDIAKR